MGYDGFPHTVYYNEIEGSDIILLETGFVNVLNDTRCLISAYDKYGNAVVQKVITAETTPKIPSSNWKPFDSKEGCLLVTGVFGNYLQISFGSYYTSQAQGIYGYLNIDTGDIYAQGTVDLPEQLLPVIKYTLNDYDREFYPSDFSYVEKTPFRGIYFYGNADESEWGFMNSKGKAYVSFIDSSNFSDTGYALVTKDKKTYYFMDKDYNIIKDYAFEGCLASIDPNGKTFKVTKEDGTIYAIHLE